MHHAHWRLLTSQAKFTISMFDFSLVLCFYKWLGGEKALLFLYPLCLRNENESTATNDY